MQFNVDNLQPTRINQIDVVRDGVVLEFSMKTYNRTTFFNVASFFDNLNLFLKSLPEEKQELLFSKYVEVKRILEEVHESSRLHSMIQGSITEIYNIITFDELKNWFLKYGQINIPADLKERFDGEDNDLTEKLTYLRSDYYDLTILSSLLKLVSPIFGEYIDCMSKDIGTKFKEHMAFSLLVKSPLFELVPFKRLEVYIDASLEKEKRKNSSNGKSSSAVFGGLGTSELPTWLLSKAVVRKLAIYEEKSGNSIIANVYHSIDQQIRSLDKTFGGTVKDKQLFNNQKGEEDKASIVENYKVKQEISDGDLSVLSIYVDQLHSMINIVDPTIDMNLVDICDKNLKDKTNFKISKHQITLAQWVLSKAISPRGVPSLKKSSILKAIAGAQAVLWSWGFHELALLMTCEPYYGGDTSAGNTPTRLGKRYVAIFTELYPHRQILSKNAHVRGTNPATKAIDSLAGELVKSDWTSMAPRLLEVKNNISIKGSLYYISADIKTELAELLIKLASTRPSALTKTSI